MGQNTLGESIRPEEALVRSSLDEVVRRGAQELLRKAVEVEMDVFLER